MNQVQTCTDALNAITLILSAKEVTAANFVEAMKAFERYKNGVKSAVVAETLGLGESHFQDFLKDLRKLRAYLQVAEVSEQSNCNVQIAALRLMDWFGEISRTIDALQPIVVKSTDDFAKGRGYKQIRAAELVIRSLISETYGNQEKLLKAIHNLFKREETISKIKNNAELGDIISGTDFSQLMALFLNPDDYNKYYQPIYDSVPFLSFLRNKRETLQLFLDDIRRIRNRIAHHRPLTSAQIELLDLYYDQILGPIQSAHDDGHVRVNPDAHMDVSDKDLEGYIGQIKEDLGEIKKDLGVIKEDLGEIKKDLGVIGKTVDGIEEGMSSIGEGVVSTGGDVSWLRCNAKWITGGVAVLAMIAFTSVGLIENTRQTTFDVKKDTTDIKSDTSEIKTGIRIFDSKLENVKQEISSDPRKELANRGVQWNERELEAALVRGDMATTELFVRGGMDPMVSSSNLSAPIAAIVCQPDAKAKLEKLKELGVDLRKFYNSYIGRMEFLGKVTINENLLAGYLRRCKGDDPSLTIYFVANGILLEKTFLEKAGDTMIKLPKRLAYATHKPRSIAVLLETNAIDFSVKDGQLIDYLFARGEDGEALSPVGRDSQCKSLAKAKYPSLYARLNMRNSRNAVEKHTDAENGNRLMKPCNSDPKDLSRC